MSARGDLRAAIEGGGPVFAPVCLDPLTARTIEALGYGAAYLSGGGLGFQLAVSEALLTTTELATAARQITQRSAVPLIVDGGVGFGDALHASRAIREFEAAGAAAVELEDQVAPKRAHHHKGVEHLIPAAEMVGKLEAALAARSDPDLLIIARTGAVRNESFAAAVERGRAYRAAGADLVMLFPSSEEEWRRAPSRIGAPLAAMGAFATRSKAEWRQLGWPLVIDPFSGQALAYAAMREAYARFQSDGVAGIDPSGAVPPLPRSARRGRPGRVLRDRRAHDGAAVVARKAARPWPSPATSHPPPPRWGSTPIACGSCSISCGRRSTREGCRRRRWRSRGRARSPAARASAGQCRAAPSGRSTAGRCSASTPRPRPWSRRPCSA